MGNSHVMAKRFDHMIVLVHDRQPANLAVCHQASYIFDESIWSRGDDLLRHDLLDAKLGQQVIQLYDVICQGATD